MIKLISFIVLTHFFSSSMNLKFEGNQVTYFKLNQQYFLQCIFTFRKSLENTYKINTFFLSQASSRQVVSHSRCTPKMQTCSAVIHTTFSWSIVCLTCISAKCAFFYYLF